MDPPQELNCCSVGGGGDAALIPLTGEGPRPVPGINPRNPEESILSDDHVGLSGNKV